MEAATPLNEFALQLFNVLRETSPDSNTLTSPISIITALSMVLLGAKENTEKQMIESMKVDGTQLMKWHEALGSLLTTLKAGRGDGTSAMNVANKVFVDEDYKVLESYTDALVKHYKSEYGSVNFKSDPSGAVNIINEWVKDETKGKIPNLLSTLSTATRAVLVNAVHFKGFWKDPFKKERVTDVMFHVNSNKTMKIRMMHRKIKIPYGENDDAMAIELPFKEEGYSMHFILPKERFGLRQLEDKLLKSKSTLDALLNVSYPQDVIVSIPKFKMRSHFDLVEQLTALGMKDLFDGSQCNLSGISGAEDLVVSSVIHEACLEVTEDGAEAAAATGVAMMLTSMPKPDPRFYADHPFLVSINYKKSILFLGRVFEPQQIE